MSDGAVLIIRLWLEGEGDERRVVARLTSFVDADSDETAAAVVGSVDELLAATRDWAEGVLDLG
jgi:hypothetical protein